MYLDLIDWLIIGFYLVLSLAIGFYFKNRAGKSITDFFVGGRNLPWFIAGISMVATTFAADTPLAVTELVGQSGISGNWLWWNMLIGGMLTTFFFARLWRRSGVLTELEFIELRYSGKAAKFLRGFKAIYLGLIMNALVLGWVNLAMMSILEVFFDIHGDALLWYTAGAMLIAAAYSAMSGIWGVAVTDAVQFIIAMVGAIVLAVIVISSNQIGGISGLKEQLPSSALDFFPKISGDMSVGDVGSTLCISFGAFLAYGFIQWWASWYPGAEPGGGGYIVQRMLSTKSEKHSIFATLFFQITHYAIRPWPWILVGLAAVVLYPDLPEADKRFGYVMAMREFLPAGLKGLLLVAFLAAYMSTISTQLNFGSSFLVNDFYMLLFKNSTKTKSSEHFVMIARIVTIAIMVIALFFTTQIESITGVWKFIIECGAGLGMVLILRWYWWRINVWSEIAATITPFIIYALSKYFLGWKFPDSFFLTVGITTIVWILVTFITKAEEESVLVNFYKKVKPDGFWNPIQKLSGLNYKNPSLWNLVACWISSIVMTYSILFFTGKLIFHEWNDVVVWGSVGLLSFAVFRFFVGRTKIFEE